MSTARRLREQRVDVRKLCRRVALTHQLHRSHSLVTTLLSVFRLIVPSITSSAVIGIWPQYPAIKTRSHQSDRSRSLSFAVDPLSVASLHQRHPAFI